MRKPADIWRDLEGFAKPACPQCNCTHTVILDPDGYYCGACEGGHSLDIPNGWEFDQALSEFKEACRNS